MKKFILILVLTVLFLSFLAFFINVFIKLKSYRNEKVEKSQEKVSVEATENESPSKYLDYSKEEYDKALADKRVLVIFFIANWCPECLNQDRLFRNVLEDLTKEGVVGLRSHILDSETTTETDALAKKFNIAKENSIVILDKNGVIAFKHTGNLKEEDLKTKILEVVNK